MSTELPLQGCLIAVPETRELEVFVDLLMRRGAQVLSCPLVSILDAPDPAPVLAWIGEFNAGRCDDLILQTGEGLRRLLRCIDQHAPQLRPGFLQQLARVRKITRGPKPARVLRELGLKSDVAASVATTAGVIEALRTLDLRNRHVGVQLYGTEPNRPLIDCIVAAGSVVHVVAPYVYADAVADSEVLSLIARLRQGEISAIAFTSMAQIKRLFDVAEKNQRLDELRAGLSATRVAAVGPVVADALKARGVDIDTMPQDSWFMKPLTQALIASLNRT